MIFQAAAGRHVTPKLGMPLSPFNGRSHRSSVTQIADAPPSFSTPRAVDTAAPRIKLRAAPFMRRGQRGHATHPCLAPAHSFTAACHSVTGTHARSAGGHLFKQRGQGKCGTQITFAALPLLPDAATPETHTISGLSRPHFTASRHSPADTHPGNARGHLSMIRARALMLPKQLLPESPLRPAANRQLPSNQPMQPGTLSTPRANSRMLTMFGLRVATFHRSGPQGTCHPPARCPDRLLRPVAAPAVSPKTLVQPGTFHAGRPVISCHPRPSRRPAPYDTQGEHNE